MTVLASLWAAPGYCDRLEVGDKAPYTHAQKWINLKPGSFEPGDAKGHLLLVVFGVFSDPVYGQWVGQLCSLAEKYAPTGLVVVALTYESEEDVAPVMLANEVNFIVGVESQSHDYYGVSTMPAAFLVGPDGRVLWIGSPYRVGPAIEQSLASVEQDEERRSREPLDLFEHDDLRQAARGAGPSLAVGDVAPDFSAAKWFNIPYATLSWKRLANRIVVLMFEMLDDDDTSRWIEYMNSIYHSYDSGQVAVVWLTLRDNRDFVSKDIRQLDAEFPLGFDSTSYKDYGLRLFPASVIVSPDRTIRWMGHPSDLVKPLQEAIKAVFGTAAATNVATPGTVIVPLKVGDAVPDFAAEDWSNSGGKKVNLDSLKDHIAVLAFWSPDDTGIGSTVALLNMLHKSCASHGIPIIALTTESKDDVEYVMDNWRMTYTVGFESHSDAAYHVPDTPYCYVVSPHGTVFWGGHPEPGLKAALQHAVKMFPEAVVRTNGD
jgi:hypothetical protein